MTRPQDVVLERLDPLSAASARPITIALLTLALGLGLADSWVKYDQVSSPWALGVAVAALVAAAALLFDRSRLMRPRWTVRSALLLHVILEVMLAASVAATFTQNAQLRDDWAPIVIGLMLLALAPYRPPREIALWAVLHTAAAATWAIVQSPWALADVPTPVFGVTGSLPALTLGAAAAAYAYSFNDSVLKWRDRAWEAARSAARDRHDGVARSVQQQQVTMVNREVIPLLSRVAEDAYPLTEFDREDAIELSRRIRRVLVDAVERGWADHLLDELLERRGDDGCAATVDDAENLGRSASLELRTLIRALATEAILTLRASEVHLELRQTDAGALFVAVTVGSAASPAELRKALRSLIGVARGLAERCAARDEAGRLVLEFEYGH